jgi:hypothetical protein
LKDQNKGGQYAQRVVTDKLGQYGFKVPPGRYSMGIFKPGFNFPSRTRTEGYRGDVIDFDKAGIVSIDLYCDPVDTRSAALHYLDYVKQRVQDIWWPFLVLGALSSLYFFLQSVTITNGLFVVAYLGLSGLEIARRNSRHNLLVVTRQGSPIANAGVYLIRSETGQGIANLKTNEKGEAALFAAPGTYNVQIVDKQSGRILEQLVDLPHGKLERDVKIVI